MFLFDNHFSYEELTMFADKWETDIKMIFFPLEIWVWIQNLLHIYKTYTYYVTYYWNTCIAWQIQ